MSTLIDVRNVSKAFGGVVIGDLLVGFKYIGNILGELETHGRFGDVEASLDDDGRLGARFSDGVLDPAGITRWTADCLRRYREPASPGLDSLRVRSFTRLR